MIKTNLDRQEPSKLTELIQDWYWVVGVSLVSAILAYGFTAPLSYAVVAHLIATLAYIGFLLLFGRGSVVEGALLVLILANVFAFASRPLHRFIQEHSAKPDQVVPTRTTR